MRGSETPRRLACGLAALVLLGAAPGIDPGPAGGAAPSRQTRYTVLPFVFTPAQRDLIWLPEAFALSVADRLELLGFTVASRRERVEIAASAGLASPSPLTLASRLKLARAVRCDRAVTGTLAFESPESGGPAARHLIVTMIVIDVDADRILHRRTLRGTMNELFSMIDEVALEAAWQDPSPPGPEARAAIKKLKDPPLPAFEAAMRAVVEEDPDRQAGLIESALATTRDHPLMQRRLADRLIETGRVEEGLARLRAIDPATQPDPWRVYLDLGEILLAREEIDEAKRLAALSIAARDTAAAHLLTARLALLEGDAARAAAEARTAGSLDPGHPGVAALLAQISSP